MPVPFNGTALFANVIYIKEKKGKNSRDETESFPLHFPLQVKWGKRMFYLSGLPKTQSVREFNPCFVLTKKL